MAMFLIRHPLSWVPQEHIRLATDVGIISRLSKVTPCSWVMWMAKRISPVAYLVSLSTYAQNAPYGWDGDDVIHFEGEVDKLSIWTRALSPAEIQTLMYRKPSADDVGLAGLEHGANDYITKPFNADELKARIQNLLQRQQRLRECFQASSASSSPARPIDSIEITSSDDAFLQQLRATVEAHMADETFKVEHLADALGLEHSYLYRRMRTLTHESPSAYLRDVRLERAAALLAGKAGTVSEIAYGVGFKSVPHFSTCFRKRYGCSPSAYAD